MLCVPSQIAGCETRLLRDARQHAGTDLLAVMKANTVSGQPGRDRMRCEPEASRLMLQPMRKSAARTRRAFAEPHWLMLRRL